MDLVRFNELAARYGRLKVVVAGDFCLDRYLEIDPALEEVSLETRLPAHQVVRVRAQLGGAGNVLANVAALGAKEVRPVGVCGCDGEGFEMLSALRAVGASTKHFLRSRQRRTFVYTKPLVIRPDRPPEELSRLDIRDREPMPGSIKGRLMARLLAAAGGGDALILMEQVARVEQGVLSPSVKRYVAELAGQANWPKVVLADSRCDAGAFAGVHVKVNRAELRRHFGASGGDEAALAARWAKDIKHCVFVTLGAEGMLAAEPDGSVHRVPGIPIVGPIDIVGAGDTVLAHLTMALAAGATPPEAIAVANVAGSVVVRKIGATGTATADEVRQAWPTT